MRMGTVRFQESQIVMNSITLYGNLTCDLDYTKAFIGNEVIQKYASWTHSFNFLLQYRNGATMNGKFYLHAKIDQVYGNLIKTQCKLAYMENEKKYNIYFHQNGYQFQFYEQRNRLREVIKYGLENVVTKTYIQHLKMNQLKLNQEIYDYYESSHISQSRNNEHQLCMVLRKELGDVCIKHSTQELPQLKDFIVQTANYMNLFSPNTKQKISKLIEEFSIDGYSILRNLFCTCFYFYTKEKLETLFGVKNEKENLKEEYFKDDLEIKILKYTTH